MSFENIGESGSKNGHKNPKAGVDQKHSNGKEINILVLGMPGVGKTGKIYLFIYFFHFRRYGLYGVKCSFQRLFRYIAAACESIHALPDFL